MTDLRIALPIFFSKPVAARAFKVALIVGIILAFINHGDLILSGQLTAAWLDQDAGDLSGALYRVFCYRCTLAALEARQQG